MPSRWMTGGKGLDDFRSEMINDQSIRILHDYLDASLCFPTVQIEGGICYFLWNKREKGHCSIFTHSEYNTIKHSVRYLAENDSDVFIRDSNAVVILNKVKALTDESFANIVLPRNPFGVYDEENILADKGNNSQWKIFGRFGRERCLKYLKFGYTINKNKEVAVKWKVFISKADGAAGQLGNPIPAKIIGKAELGDKQTICTETFLAIAPFETKEQAENAISYTKTKFFRFMVGIRKLKNMTRDTYTFVPLQDFSRPWTDADLYAKYGLTDEEIQFIESMIKPME